MAATTVDADSKASEPEEAGGDGQAAPEADAAPVRRRPVRDAIERRTTG
jgi:hypothetical protein